MTNSEAPLLGTGEGISGPWQINLHSQSHWDLLFHFHQHVSHCYLWFGNHLYTKKGTDFL